jgi:hypothetical protein
VGSCWKGSGRRDALVALATLGALQIAAGMGQRCLTLGWCSFELRLATPCTWVSSRLVFPRAQWSEHPSATLTCCPRSPRPIKSAHPRHARQSDPKKNPKYLAGLALGWAIRQRIVRYLDHTAPLNARGCLPTIGCQTATSDSHIIGDGSGLVKCHCGVDGGVRVFRIAIP